MSKILNQAWEDVASDVTGAIEEAVKPLLKKAVDDIYGGLLDATQDYLSSNLAFNIASRISTAEREASDARQENEDLRAAYRALHALAIHGDLDRLESNASGTERWETTSARISAAHHALALAESAPC